MLIYGKRGEDLFGYIRVGKPELKIKEFEMYKAVYCSLCKRLGKDYGIFSRFALSYDFTFTALIELALADSFCGVKRKSCTFNPFKKCSYCVNDEHFALSSAALIILGYYKIQDDIKDEKGFNKLSAKFKKLLFNNPYKKAKKAFPEIDDISKEYFFNQQKAEKNEKTTLDDAAEPSSIMLEKLLPMCARDEKDKKVLSFLGRLMGRYIYLLDCLVDRQRDIKKGSFNPLSEMDEKEAKEKIKAQLYIVINEAKNTFELLNIKRFKNILGNIIYVGLEDTMLSEINRLEKNK